ncbi:class F sortase [Candidatus Saccharibacteria bacterium]|nr:class F sortase [Candidatus Saccharibacteria bacterium]
MSLRIKGWRSIVKWSVWGLLSVLFLIFFIKVATYEASYYSQKEGSERAVVEEVAVEPAEELIEEEPTDQEIYEYVVAADRPRYLSISKLGITNRRVLPMGVNASGELDTPRNIFDVGWYEASGKPGQGGTMVIDGHNGGPHVVGVFKNLPSLVDGDIITIERGDGIIYNYAVVENNEVLLTDADAYMATASQSPRYGMESLTLITCTGEWSQQQQTYLSRQFVRAVLVE